MKIEFIDHDIKRQSKSIFSAHPAISYILLSLPRIINEASSDQKRAVGKIVDAIMEINYARITVLMGNVLIDITVNYESKKIKVSTIAWPYRIVYDDYPKRNFSPTGYEYANNDRVIFDKYLTRINPSYANLYLFKITGIGYEYNVSLDTGNDFFDKNSFITKLLYTNQEYRNIKDLIMVIAQIIDLKACKIRIVDNNDRIIINHGALVDYVEYREEKTEKQKIFLKDHNFYIEKTTCEKCDEDIATFIKKIGVYNGEEKKFN